MKTSRTESPDHAVAEIVFAALMRQTGLKSINIESNLRRDLKMAEEDINYAGLYMYKLLGVNHESIDVESYSSRVETVRDLIKYAEWVIGIHRALGQGNGDG